MHNIGVISNWKKVMLLIHIQFLVVTIALLSAKRVAWKSTNFRSVRIQMVISINLSKLNFQLNITWMYGPVKHV